MACLATMQGTKPHLRIRSKLVYFFCAIDEDEATWGEGTRRTHSLGRSCGWFCEPGWRSRMTTGGTAGWKGHVLKINCKISAQWIITSGGMLTIPSLQVGSKIL